MSLLRTVALFAIYSAIAHARYKIPKVEFLIFKNGGFKASIPAIPGTTKFEIELKINGNVKYHEATEILNERLIVEDMSIKLSLHDVIEYFVMVEHDDLGYIQDNLRYTVNELHDINSKFNNVMIPVNNRPCKKSITTVGERDTCRGDVVFEEKFKNIDKERWIIEQRLPKSNQEDVYMSYQRRTVSIISDGLKIAPILYEDSPDYNKTILKLGSDCTGDMENECLLENVNTLPPVISGKISTRDKFSFKYGRIEIKAKLPQGDWIYPELYLEPAKYKYGKEGYASGLIRIAFSRGNLNSFLKRYHIDYTNYALSGGVIFHKFEPCRLKKIKTKISSTAEWGNTYHVYGLRWTNDSIKLYVDDDEYGSIIPPEGGFSIYEQNFDCNIEGNNYYNNWKKGTVMAPFDEEFSISLGVGVGGLSDFPKKLGHPWDENEIIYEFQKNKKEWYGTWHGKSNLIVESVKVTAL